MLKLTHSSRYFPKVSVISGWLLESSTITIESKAHRNRDGIQVKEIPLFFDRTNMQKVGSSSPFPAYQHSPSPRYHPHSQREDHGDVEYISNPEDDNIPPVHRMILPKSSRDQNINNNQRDEDDLRQEKLEQSQASATYDDQRDSEESNREKSSAKESNEWRDNENFSDQQNTYSSSYNKMQNENKRPDRSNESEDLSADINKDSYFSSQNIDQNDERNDRDQNQIVEENDELEKSDVQPSNKQDTEDRDIDRYETKDLNLKQGENFEGSNREENFQKSNNQQSSEWQKGNEREQREEKTKDNVVQEKEQSTDEKNVQEEKREDSQNERGFGDKESAETDQEKDQPKSQEKDWHSEDYNSKQKSINEDTSKSSPQSLSEKNEEHMREEDYSDQDKDRVSEKPDNVKHEDKPIDKKKERKPNAKEHHGHTFVSHARTRFEERDDKLHGDIWNKPTPRSEEPPSEHRHPLFTSSSVPTVSSGSTPSAHAKLDTQTAAGSEKQQQNHLLHQQSLTKSSPSEATKANVTFAGIAVVTLPETSQATLVPSANDLELERERIARLQSETARLHGGIIPKHSDVSLAQSEIDRIEHERLRQLQEEEHRKQQEPNEERVVVPIVIETSIDVNRLNANYNNDNKDHHNKRSSENLLEESERLHHVHDNIMQEIKSCPHLDSFDKGNF